MTTTMTNDDLKDKWDTFLDECQMSNDNNNNKRPSKWQMRHFSRQMADSKQCWQMTKNAALKATMFQRMKPKNRWQFSCPVTKVDDWDGAPCHCYCYCPFCRSNSSNSLDFEINDTDWKWCTVEQNDKDCKWCTVEQSHRLRLWRDLWLVHK